MTLTQKTQGRRTIRKTAGRLLLFVAVFYLLTLGFLYAFQRQLIFNAQASHIGASGMTKPPLGAQEVFLRTAGGDKVAAYYGTALLENGRPDPNGGKRPTLLFFYGKGGSIASWRDQMQAFRRLDANVLIPDYVGFGQSSGEESEANCSATAEAAYRYLQGRPDIDRNSIIIAGYSLGSAVAVDLAARETAAHQPPAGLAVFAAFTSLAEEAHQEYPIYPTPLLRILVRSPFTSELKMRDLTCPTLIVHSRADRQIPYWMSDRLAAASHGPVTCLSINHADHPYYFLQDGKIVYAALGRFLEKAHGNHET